ncbi:MAG TPA: PAS domain S-box protein, partial [Pyrinomonadaceae bacterium]|nr:PAS domain S-box protein [Pyrinomonadaceae bacterium]
MRDKFSKILPYLVAIFIVEQMTLLKWWLDAYIGQPSPYLLFFLPIIISVWYGGIGPGLLAIVLAGFSVALFFLPDGSSSVVMLRVIRLGLFAGEALTVTWLCYLLQIAKGNADEQLREARRIAQEAKKSEERHRLMTSELPQYAIVMLDVEGRMENWNKGPAQLFQYVGREALGENFAIFYASEDRNNGLPGGHLQRAGEEGLLEASGWRVRKDGSQIWVESIIAPLRDETGRLLGYSLLMHETTERKQAEDALR